MFEYFPISFYLREPPLELEPLYELPRDEELLERMLFEEELLERDTLVLLGLLYPPVDEDDELLR